jgi:hypothetical protein
MPNPHLHHGTNLVAACSILRDGRVLASTPVDDDGLGAVVCMSSSYRVGRMFAVEFARTNSDLPVGAVFTFPAARVRAHARTLAHTAETASLDEREHRVQGDVPTTLLQRIRLVGATRLVANERWMEHLYRTTPAARIAFHGMDAFWDAAQALVARSRASTR